MSKRPVEVTASAEEKAKFQADMKAANGIKDPKEKKAKIEEVYRSKAALVTKAMKSDESKEKIKALDGKKKESFKSAVFNFGLAILLDKELVEEGSNVVSAASTDMAMAKKAVGAKEALSSVTNQLKSAGDLAAGISKWASAGGVEVKMPTFT